MEGKLFLTTGAMWPGQFPLQGSRGGPAPWSLPTAQNPGMRNHPAHRTSAHPVWAGAGCARLSVQEAPLLGAGGFQDGAGGAREPETFKRGQLHSRPQLQAQQAGPNFQCLENNDFQETKTNIRFSESTEALGNGEQHFKNGEPKPEEVYGPPPPPHPYPEARHSPAPQREHLQLFSEVKEAVWRDHRPLRPSHPRRRRSAALTRTALGARRPATSRPPSLDAPPLTAEAPAGFCVPARPA